jgi:hypothetical protein
VAFKSLIPQAILVLSWPLLHFDSPIAAYDDAPVQKEAIVTKPTIEFRDMIEKSKEDKLYTYTIIITVESAGVFEDKTFDCKMDSGISALAITASFDDDLKRNVGWKYSVDINMSLLRVEGWADPDTLIFKPVKRIKFESKDLPKEYWPAIKMPPNL